MGYSVTDALADRKKRQANQGKTVDTGNNSGTGGSSGAGSRGSGSWSVTDALKAREKQVTGTIDITSDDLLRRYQSVVDLYNGSLNNKPTFGSNPDEVLKSQRDLRLQASALYNEAEAYRKYLGDDFVDAMTSSISEIIRGQNSLMEMSKYYSQWENEDQYKAATMSTDALKGKLDEQERLIAEKEAELKDLQSRKTVASYAHGGGGYTGGSPYGARFQDPNISGTSDIDKEILRVQQELEALKNPIAYTTKGGQNVTWQMLYDNKYAAEDLETRYSEYSQAADWDEMSKGIETADDTLSDYNIIFSLQQSMMPYDRETAAASGVDMAQWEETEEQRRYIEEKYGVDLHADIYESSKILSRLMEQTDPNVPGEKDFFDNLSYLTDEERAVLSYIYNTQGRDAALQWHEGRERMYADRQSGVLADVMTEYGKDSPFWGSVGSVALGIGGSLEQVSDLLDYVATGEVGHNSFSEASSALRSGTMQEINWEIGNWDAFDFVYSTTMSGIDSYVNGALFGPGAEVMLGLGAAAQATKDAKDRGMSDQQAFWTGISAGVFESIFEHWSIGNFRGLQEIASANVKDIAKNIGKSMLVNASEETLTEIANIVYDTMINGDFSQYETMVRQYVVSGMTEEDAKMKVALELGGQILESGASGALMGLGFGALGSAGPIAGNAMDAIDADRRTNTIAKNTLQAEGGIDALRSLADEVAGVSDSKLQRKLTSQSESVGKKATTRNVGKLYKNVSAAYSAQDKTDIAKSLTEKGITEKTANAIAEAVVESGNGKILTKKQQDLLTEYMNNEDVRTALRETGAGTFERALKMATFEAGAASGNLKGFADATRTKAAAPGQEKTGVEGKLTAADKVGSYEVSEDGETRLISDPDKTVTVKGIASIEDGKVMLQLDDGSSVAAEDVSFGKESEAMVYSAVSDLNVSLDTANALVKAFNPEGDISAAMYALDIQEAYRFGEYNYPLKAVENDPYAAVKKQAWNEGRMAAIKETASKQSKVEATFQEAKKTLKQTGKEVKGNHYASLEDGVTVLSLSESQKASYNLADQIAQAAKVDIIVYVGKTGEQGYYDPKTDKIHLNLNAVNKSRQSMMAFTLGHELVHRAKKGSPAKYQAFADFLMEEYGKQGSSMDEMIAQELDAAKEYGIKMTEAEAFEEVVSDACQRMLLDTDAGKKLAEFGAQSRQNKSFLEDLKRWIVDFMNKLRKIFKDVEPDSVAAQEFAKFDEGVKQILADMFVDMTVDAGEKLSTIQAVVKENAEAVSTEEIITDGAVVTDGEIKYSIKSLKADIAEGQMFEDLKTHCGWTQEQVDELRSNLEELVAYMTPFRDVLDMNETYGREGRRFSPYKPNSDPLYKISMDFSTLCSKRLLTQYVIENLQLRENRPMSAEEQMAIRDMLNEYRKVEKGLQVACAMCYVEAARLKSPKQISKWIADPAEQMKNFFADKNPEFAAFIKEKQGDFKESRGYDRNATKKDMSAKDVRDLNKIRPKVRSQYQLSAEELQIVERAKALPASTYLTAGNLAELSETDPVIYAAYTAFVRTATRSKSLETDEPYYYGDSRRDNGNGIIVSDSFIESVNRENGMRFSSWSDWRIQHMLDYITAVIDNSVRGAAMHGYTKFGEEVRVLGKTGMMFNMSGVAGTQTGLNEDGSLSFSPTESIDVNEAIQLREEYPETAGLQCIGVGDAHIVALLRSDIIDYVIPYHVSGLNAGLRAMANIHGWADYTTTQHAAIDKSIRLENAVDKEHWREEPVFSEFFVGYDTGMSGIDAMRASADRYVQMCKDRGLKPKFEQFLKEENYWKLLIDRKMINQKTGKLIKQRAVTPTFDFTTIREVVDRHVQNYDSGLEARALNHIVENWDSIPKRIRDLKKQGGKKPKKVSKAVDTLANETLAAQPKGVEDGRKFSLPKTDSDGNQLSEDQVEFFKDSKVRDDQGRLIPMYHGTNNPDFTVFDPQFSDDGISLFFTSDPDVANTYTNLQDKGRDIDPYNLITKDSSAEQFNKAQERVGGGLRVVKITSEWIQEMKSKAEKSATRMFGIANKYADLLEYNNSTGMFSYDIERIREITNKGVDKLKTDDINKLRKAMGDAQQHSFFARDHKGAEKEIRRIYHDNFQMFDEVWNYKTAASTPDSAIGQYTYTETNSSVPFMIDRNLDFLGHITPKTEQEAVASALDRMQWVDEHHLGNRYKVYLNITNPYILDAGIDYSGKMDIVSLERSTFADNWRISFENAEHDEIRSMNNQDFMEFIDSAFDAETTAKIKAQIEEDNEAYRKEWGDDFYADLDVDHDIQLRNVNMNYTEAGNWNSLNFNGNDNARTRDVTAWAKENGYDGVIFKNMKDAGGYAFVKGRGGSTVATAFNSEQVKSVDNRKPTSNPDIRFSLPKMGDKKSPTTLTEQDLRDLLQKAKDKGMHDGTYFPVRINTPDVLLDAIRKIAEMRGITDKAELDKLTADRPIAIQVFKARQAMATEEDWDGTGKPHNLSIDDVVGIIKKMDDPEYIVYEGSTGRYVEILKYKTENGKNAFAVVELENFKGEQHLNGYGQDTYNILVTLYQPDAKEKVTKLLNGKDNIVIHPEKNKGNSQLTSGIHVPSVLNKSPFAPTVPQEKAGVKDDSGLRNKLPVGEDTSPRALLANAFEGVVQNDIERRNLKQYQQRVTELNSEEAKLQELRAEIKELSFAKGKKDTKRITELQFEANATANRIATLDKMLLRFEASAPLKNILQREKEMVRKRERQRASEALESYRNSKIDKLEKRVERQRDNAKKAAMRQKVRKVIRDLDKLLNRGDKKQNVKEGMKDLVSEALKSAEILFIDNYTNEDMIRDGVGTDLTPAEARYMEEARAILEELANLPSGSYEAMMERAETEAKLKGKLGYRMSRLQDVFVRERARLNKTQVSEVLGKLADAYKSMESSEYSYIKDAFHDNVYQYLLMLKDDVGGTIVKDMSLGQMEELHKAYTMVLTTVRNANKMFAANLKETRDNLANRVMFEVRKAGGVHGKWSKAGKLLNSFSWNNQKPVYAFERIGSNTLTTLYQNIRKGQDTWALDMLEANEKRRALQEKYKRSGWDMDKQYKFTSSSGLEFSLNLEQIMSLYAYSKREQAHEHLLKGGFVFDGNTEVVETKHGFPITYMVEDATSYNVSDEILSEIISQLNEDQRAYVDEMQDYLSTTMGEKGNSISMELYGVKLFNEKAYFPLRSAGQYMERAKEADLKKEQGQIAIVNSGFAKATTPKASNPVVLSGFMDVWADHVNEMSMYHSFVLPMEDFRRVYNYSSPHMEGQPSVSVNQVIQNAYGTAATAYIDQLYRDLNGGAVTDPREGLAKAMVGKFKKAAVMASLSVVFQQPSAIGRAFALVNPDYFDTLAITRGVGRAVFAKGKHDQMWAELKKYAPVAMIKEMGYFDTGMGRSAKDFLQAEEYHGLGEKAKAFFTDSDFRDELLSKPAAVADELTWIQIWTAVKKETAAKNPKMDKTSEEFLKLAGERFSEVIDKTQVYDSVLARSANMRSKSLFMNMATSFMAEPTTSINMIEDALRKAGKGQKKAAARTFAAVFCSILINSAFAALVYAARDDDEDETFLEKYLSSFLTEMLDGINPITYYPFLKDIWSLLQGFDVERADMSLFNDLVDVLQNLVKAYAEDTAGMSDTQLDAHNKKIAQAWLKAADSVASLLGIPFKNVRREINGVISFIGTIKADAGGRKTTWSSIKDTALADVADSIPILGWLPNDSKSDKLLDAIIGGDKAYIDRLMGAYKDEEAAAAAIRSAIKDRYMSGEFSKSEARDYLIEYGGLDITDAYWKLKEWDFDKESSGDEYGKYDSFYDAVKTGTNLKQVIQDYTDNGVDLKTLRSQITSHFKPEYVDMSASERASIKGYLLNALVACGVDREDAEKDMREWDFEAENGFAYSDRKTAYLNGDITREELRSALINFGGYEAEDAEAQIQVYEWSEMGYDASVSAVKKYNEFCKPAGVSIEHYLKIVEFSNNTENDTDPETGKKISYSAVKKVMAQINNLAISNAQKTAIALSLWKESTVQKYKLW